ncbi:MAG: lysophospholipid acyltransferase family protein [Rhodobacteraceae bacterium]|nr:lysophospholipid acyltransferase family protein [Paracoccaceae bacterium]
MPVQRSELSVRQKLVYRIGYGIVRCLLAGLLLVPYERRVAAAGWVSSRLAAPLAGYRKRIRTNLQLVCPDLTRNEVDRLVQAVPDNAGRTIIEVFSTAPFVARSRAAELVGPGFKDLQTARADGRPVIIVTAHFGNFYAILGCMRALGYEMGALYRRMGNPYFNDHYLRHISRLSGSVFEQGPQGMRDLIRHLRSGGMLGILNDVHVAGGAPLTFFGEPAKTSLATAELALRFNCVLLPVYVQRQKNGLDFMIETRPPIGHSDPRTMTQALNDDLERTVRDNMGQWFWIHRRWKDAPARDHIEHNG